MHGYSIVLRMQDLIGKIKRVVTGTSQRRDNGVCDLGGRNKKKNKTFIRATATAVAADRGGVEK